MRDLWLGLVESLLRPSRPHLERCARERQAHLDARSVAAEHRARAIAACEGRIRAARAAVFAADDGVVTSRMTELEREWRTLSRSDRDAGLMDLWSRIAPPSWIDRKRWRDDAPASQLDTAVALAADPDGVEAAERAALALCASLEPWGVIGPRVRWRSFERDVDCTTDLLAEPLDAASRALATLDAVRDAIPRADAPRWSVIDPRARDLEREVHDAALARLPERPLFARAVARAAFVDVVWRAASMPTPGPAARLRALWVTGYAVSAVDAAGVILEVP